MKYSLNILVGLTLYRFTIVPVAAFKQTGLNLKHLWATVKDLKIELCFLKASCDELNDRNSF